MRIVPTGRTATEVVEVHDNQQCVCGALLVKPHVQFGTLPCSCVPGGHRSIRCLDCGAVFYEPPHDPDAG